MVCASARLAAVLMVLEMLWGRAAMVVFAISYGKKITKDYVKL